MSAQDGTEFMRGIKHGFDCLYRDALDSARQGELFHQDLREAFEQTKSLKRQKHILEMCSWPLLDKVALPQEYDEPQEFLWLFALPFTVQFSLQAVQKPILFEGDLVDGAQLLRILNKTGRINPEAELGMFPILVSKEDLHSYGPQNLSALFLAAETGQEYEGEEAFLQPKPLTFDPEIESGRVATLFFICTARLPVGQRELLHSTNEWDSEMLSYLVKYGLQAQGFDVEQVQSLPPCSMAEALLKCTRTGVPELECVLKLAKHHYGVREVKLRFPMSGMAELSMQADEEDEELTLMPPFSFIEPPAELHAAVTRLCEEAGLPFSGAYSTACAPTAMLQ